ncbi:DUF7426 family protein [Actinophytocola sediminis]
MATFPDLSSFDHYMSEVDGGTLTLPIRGRDWTWRAGELSMWAMLKIHHVQRESARVLAAIAAGEPRDPGQLILDDADDARLSREIVGDARAAELVEAGATVAEYNHIVRTLLSWHVSGEAAALATWSRTGKETKPDPPARAASTKTAGSSTTRKKATGSRGTRSSRTGTTSKRTSSASTKRT